MSNSVVTGIVRADHVHLIDPHSPICSKNFLTIIIPKSDKANIEKISSAIKDAAKDGMSKWKGISDSFSIRSPLQEGYQKRSRNSAYKKSFFINCHSSIPPAIWDRKRLHISPEKIYSGCYIRVIISFHPINSQSICDIVAILEGIQFWKDGNRIGSAG